MQRHSRTLKRPWRTRIGVSPVHCMNTTERQHQLPPLAGEAGAAFLLRAPAESSATIEHPAGVVRLIAEAPCLTVELHTTVETDAVRDECWRIAQEALDVHAATHRKAYATKHGDSSFTTWKLEPDGYTLTVTDTGESRWFVHAVGVVHSPPGSPPPPPPLPPVQPHPALRYYRLSQLSHDLFDAFRNAYLALEYLVSEVSQKGTRESEPDWLIRVLSGTLAAAIPSGIDIRSFVSSVYEHGRLPVFHAKAYRTVYLPQGIERSSVQGTFETLQLVLASIQHHQLDARIPQSWAQMSEEVEDAMARATYLSNQVAFKCGSQSIQADVVLEIVETPRHFGSIWARTQLLDPPSLPVLEAIDFLKDGSPQMDMKLPFGIPLVGVSKVRIELRQVQGSTKAPTRLHES